jgi:dihydrofolate reductase
MYVEDISAGGQEGQVGRIVVSEFVSLDGVMEAPGGDDGFVRGAWTFEFDRGDEGDQFKTEETFGAEALLLGRRTYEGFANAWPGREGEFADRFNTMPKYVVSSTLKDPEWENSRVVSFDELPRLRDETDGDLIVHGSQSLAAALVAADMVDELRLMIFPVVLGTGRKLFGDADEARRYALHSSAVAGDGVALMVYRKG